MGGWAVGGRRERGVCGSRVEQQPVSSCSSKTMCNLNLPAGLVPQLYAPIQSVNKAQPCPPAPRRHRVCKQRLQRRIVGAAVAAQQRRGGRQHGDSGPPGQRRCQQAAGTSAHKGSRTEQRVAAVAVGEIAGGQGGHQLGDAVKALGRKV